MKLDDHSVKLITINYLVNNYIVGTAIAMPYTEIRQDWNVKQDVEEEEV